ncbi:MAG TPA: MATE family efflux transporter [Planctomycetota bacterium]
MSAGTAAQPAPPTPSPQRSGVWREAWRLSVPATLALLLHSGYRVNDQYWVQDLGAPAQAALGLTSFVVILNFAFVSLVHSGALARAARACGAGDRPLLESVYSTTLKFGLTWFTIIGALGWLAGPLWVRALGANGEVAAMGQDYLQVLYLCMPLIGMKPVIDAMFIAQGNTLVPMLLSVLSVGLNFVLNPLLIYGAGPVPAMGVAGAAWATGAARGVAALLGALLLVRLYGLRPKWKEALHRAEVRAIARIGWPMALSVAGYAGVFIVMLKTTIEPFGETVQAGLGVAFNGVEAISYCGLMGPAIAVSSMVGRRLGAGDVAGAAQSVRACLTMSCGIAAVATVAFLAVPERLAALYTGDPGVRAEAARYLWIVGWTQLATAAQSVYEQALAGAGRTLAMSLTNLAGNGVRIPLAWLFAHRLAWGPAGAWWAMNVSNLLKLGAIVAVFRRGGWRATRVPAADLPQPPRQACPPAS